MLWEYCVKTVINRPHRVFGPSPGCSSGKALSALEKVDEAVILYSTSSILTSVFSVKLHASFCIGVIHFASNSICSIALENLVMKPFNNVGQMSMDNINWLHPQAMMFLSCWFLYALVKGRFLFFPYSERLS